VTSEQEKDALTALNGHFESEGGRGASTRASDWTITPYRDAFKFVPAQGRSNWVFVVRAGRVGGFSPMLGNIETAYQELLEA
jgi:hypothetical protein